VDDAKKAELRRICEWGAKSDDEFSAAEAKEILALLDAEKQASDEAARLREENEGLHGHIEELHELLSATDAAYLEAKAENERLREAVSELTRIVSKRGATLMELAGAAVALSRSETKGGEE
jgi:predicted  nucleic acid-binding Zn-ribbon protein